LSPTGKDNCRLILESNLRQAEIELGLSKQVRAKERLPFTVEVARKLNESLNGILTYDIRLEEIAHAQCSNGITRQYFERIYRSNTELLSSVFTHVSSRKIEGLKVELIEKLQKFLDDLNTTKYTHIYPHVENKLEACRSIISQTIQLIYSAKTVSAIVSSIAVQADVLAQMQLAASLTDNRLKALVRQARQVLQDDAFISPAILFRDVLPKTLNDYQLNPGTNLHDTGSAFQLEGIREKFIGRLEQYLRSRARYDGEEIRYDIDDRQIVTKKYTAVDRGFFYNKALQDAHIKVAAELLTQLDRMQLRRGTRIDNPQLFAEVLMEARDANEKNIETLSRSFDGTGDLFALLNDVRFELGNVYQNQKVHIGSSGANLREQLGLEPTTQSYVRN